MSGIGPADAYTTKPPVWFSVHCCVALPPILAGPRAGICLVAHYAIRKLLACTTLSYLRILYWAPKKDKNRTCDRDGPSHLEVTQKFI